MEPDRETGTWTNSETVCPSDQVRLGADGRFEPVAYNVSDDAAVVEETVTSSQTAAAPVGIWSTPVTVTVRVLPEWSGPPPPLAAVSSRVAGVASVLASAAAVAAELVM